MASPTITIDELLAEIERQNTSAGEGETVEEISSRTGVSDVKVRGYLKKLIADGRMVARKKLVRNITGAMSPVPCYAVVNGKKKK